MRRIINQAGNPASVCGKHDIYHVKGRIRRYLFSTFASASQAVTTLATLGYLKASLYLGTCFVLLLLGATGGRLVPSNQDSDKTFCQDVSCSSKQAVLFPGRKPVMLEKISCHVAATREHICEKGFWIHCPFLLLLMSIRPRPPRTKRHSCRSYLRVTANSKTFLYFSSLLMSWFRNSSLI